MLSFLMLMSTMALCGPLASADNNWIELSDVAIIEAQPKMDGRTMIMMLAPKK